MKISREQLQAAAKKAGVPPEKLEGLWKALQDEGEEVSPYLKWFYFLGALIAIFAMTWFFNLSWSWFGSGFVTLLGLGYAILFFFLGRFFWNKGETLPGGLLITMAVSMVPLIIYSLQADFSVDKGGLPYEDFYHTVDRRWVLMEVGTILAGIAAFRAFPFPFLMAPISLAAFFLSMDLAPFLFGKELTFDQKSWISILFGVILFGLSYIVRLGGFWLSLFGALAFFGGIGCLLWDRGTWQMALFLLISLALMPLGIYLRRNILLILGAIGVFAYLAHLSYKYFQDSILFPIILSLLGLAIIGAGILFQRYREKLLK